MPEMDAFEILKDMKFKDALGHPLENCVDFIAIERALRYYADSANWSRYDARHGDVWCLEDGDTGDVAKAVIRRDSENLNYPKEAQDVS